jgi:hypothetical protein
MSGLCLSSLSMSGSGDGGGARSEAWLPTKASLRWDSRALIVGALVRVLVAWVRDRGTSIAGLAAGAAWIGASLTATSRREAARVLTPTSTTGAAACGRSRAQVSPALPPSRMPVPPASSLPSPWRVQAWLRRRPAAAGWRRLPERCEGEVAVKARLSLLPGPSWASLRPYRRLGAAFATGLTAPIAALTPLLAASWFSASWG